MYSNSSQCSDSRDERQVKLGRGEQPGARMRLHVAWVRSAFSWLPKKSRTARGTHEKIWYRTKCAKRKESLPIRRRFFLSSAQARCSLSNITAGVVNQHFAKICPCNTRHRSMVCSSEILCKRKKQKLTWCESLCEKLSLLSSPSFVWLPRQLVVLLVLLRSGAAKHLLSESPLYSQQKAFPKVSLCGADLDVRCSRLHCFIGKNETKTKQSANVQTSLPDGRCFL